MATRRVSSGRVSSGRVSSVSTRDAGVSGVSTSVSAGVVLLSLVVLGYLQTLLDVAELDANDPVVGDSVHGSGGAVVGGDSVRDSMRAVGSTLVSFVLDLVLKDDVLDLL